MVLVFLVAALHVDVVVVLDVDVDRVDDGVAVVLDVDVVHVAVVVLAVELPLKWKEGVLHHVAHSSSLLVFFRFRCPHFVVCLHHSH